MIDTKKLDEILAQKGFKSTNSTSNWYSQLDRNKNKPMEKKTFMEKVANFTGGEKIAQGLGQALANPEIAKQQEQLLNDAIKQQGELLKRRKEITELGGDTSHIDKGLEYNKQQLDELGSSLEGLMNQKGLTTKQVLGDALQLGTTVLGAGQLPGMAKTAVAKTGIIAGAKAGAIQGVKAGAVYGTSSGVAGALKEDKSLKDVAIGGLKGGAIGAVTGGVLGGVIGGVSGGIKQAVVNKQNKYLDAITPNTKDLTPTEYEDLLNRGKITPKTATQPSKYILSDTEKQVAQKYKNLFTNDPVKNTDNIINEIAKKDKEVGTFLEKNNGIFNSGELKNSIKNGLKDISDVTIPESRIEKLKKTMIDNFIGGLKKNDMKTLWTARKEFDRQIESAFSGSPTLQNTVKKEFRNAIQTFISEKTPDGVYKTSMKEMTQLFNLKDITNNKAIKEKGLNAIQLWVKRNPTKAKAIGYTAGGIVGERILHATTGIGF